VTTDNSTFNSTVSRSPSRHQVLAEIILIFAVFAIQGAWPAPDVNESHYLGKIVHFWNPDSFRGDLFLESPDTHKVFCYTFGWLSLWLSPVTLAWTGRVLAWALLAWTWRRLSFAVVPRAWWSVLTAAMFACLMERCHMAGEWVIGGIEAKPFAYVFVFLGIESLVRDRWNRALLLFGTAAAFHVMVGGWAAVAAGVAWLWLRTKSQTSPLPPLRSLLPGILGGLLLSLPGIIPSLMLDWNADSQTVRAAHQIYVFERLPHHLTLTGMRPDFILRLALLWAFWLLLGRWSRRTPQLENERPVLCHLRAFVAGAVTITFVGAAINTLAPFYPALAADLLRYYWFRLSDVALPLGVSLECVAVLTSRLDGNSRVPTARGCLALLILTAVFHIGDHAWERFCPTAPRSHRIADFADWEEACHWIAHSGTIPADARFFVPRLAQTFRWYTGHSDVVNCKDVPQDAETLLKWRRRIQTIYATDFPNGPRWYDPLATVGAKRLRQLGLKYNAEFIITERTDPLPNLDIVHQNQTYVIYRLK
jgi:hypothetical protein